MQTALTQPQAVFTTQIPESFDRAKVALCEEINAELARCSRQLVLTHRQIPVPVVEQSRTDQYSIFECGLLTGERLLFRQLPAHTHVCFFPTACHTWENYEQQSDPEDPYRIERRDAKGPMYLSLNRLVEADVEQYTRLVGNIAVKHWLTQNRLRPRYRFAELLTRLSAAA